LEVPAVIDEVLALVLETCPCTCPLMPAPRVLVNRGLWRKSLLSPKNLK